MDPYHASTHREAMLREDVEEVEGAPRVSRRTVMIIQTPQAAMGAAEKKAVGHRS